MANVFISVTHRKDEDVYLAKELYEFLVKHNHDVFLAKSTLRVGDDWNSEIKDNLEICEYFIVLLSDQSITSDMVTEEIKIAKQRQGTEDNGFPKILPIRVNLGYDIEMNYDLNGYLSRIQQLLWLSSEDTSTIFNEILDVIENKKKQKILSEDEVEKKENLKIFSECFEPIGNAPLEYPEGQVRVASKFYVKRELDDDCFKYLKAEGALIRIKAPRQYGKTSLLSRLLDDAKSNHKIVSISFHLLDYKVLESLDSLLKFMATKVIRKIKLDKNMIAEYWEDEYLGSKSKMMDLFEEYILEEINEPIILALDEVDRLFPLDKISDDFFSLIRAMHEESKSNVIWEKFKIILVHSTEPMLAVNSIDQSPFYNVGFSVNLLPFTLREIDELAKRYNIFLTEREINKLLDFLGGHPYLTRKTLYHMAYDNIELNELLSDAFKDTSIYSDHFRRYLLVIQKNLKLVEVLKNIIDKKGCLDERECYALKAAGIIKGNLDKCNFSCTLYKNFFTKYLR